MLRALSIRDIVLIDRLDISLEEHLSVLTGETGAGKSIMLDALGLALGARGDAGLVRQSCEKGSVIASFDIPPESRAARFLLENDIPLQDDLILRRVQNSDGRTRAFINDQPVSAGLLRELGQLLVEIHGQHEERAMLEPAAHRRLLDAYGDLEDLRNTVRTTWNAWQEARADLKLHEQALEKARSEQDYLQHSVEELRLLNPEIGEEEVLAEKRQLMMHGEKFSKILNEALSSLSNDGALDAHISASLRKLERSLEAAAGTFDQPVAALERVLTELVEARSSVEESLRQVEFDPASLEQTEERLFALRAASRKYDVSVDNLAALRTRMEAELGALESDENRSTHLKAQCEKTKTDYFELAEKLSTSRIEQAARLDEKITSELPPLKLDRAVFKTQVTRLDDDQAGPAGLDRVEFEVATNPGSSPGGLMKVASGGELARIILSLKVVLASKGSAPTLIFDEIDTGVGGAVAEAIGVRLEKLSSDLQIIAVTHSPQVAARASGHMRIEKRLVSGTDERMSTSVETLDTDARHEEVARMLAGSTITDEARAAAKSLIGGGDDG